MQQPDLPFTALVIAAINATVRKGTAFGEVALNQRSIQVQRCSKIGGITAAYVTGSNQMTRVAIRIP